MGLEERAPSKVNDPAFREWWASYLRMGASPGAAVALTRMNAEIDIRGVLSSVRVPTLVLHRSGDRCLKVEEGRYLASHIPGATFVELAGDDHLPFIGDQEAMLREIEQFLTRTQVRTHAPAASERVLASVLTVTWQADPRAPIDTTLRPIFDREVASARGHRLGVSPDRLVASFDGPGRAVRCGTTLIDAAIQSGVAARGGLHIGERMLTDDSDPVLQFSADMAAAAVPGQLLRIPHRCRSPPGFGAPFRAARATRHACDRSCHCRSRSRRLSRDQASTVVRFVRARD